MYQSIHKLPLLLFIDILTSKNYSLLLLSGTATPEALQLQWESLYNDYIEAIGGKEFQKAIANNIENIVLQSKVQNARSLINALGIHPTDGLFRTMYEFDYDLPEKEYTPENLSLVLRLFIANYKSEYMDLQLVVTHAGKQSQAPQSDVDYKYFMNTVANIMTGLKMSIDINSLTVGLYCALVVRYKEHCAVIANHNKMNQNDGTV